jgi:homoserine dehydrogenase
MKPVRVGLLGIGTVGGGTYTVLTRNREEITRRAGRHIEIAWVVARDLERARSIVGPDIRVLADAQAAVKDPDVDVIVEVIGGTTVAKDAILTAIAHGKHVVTANKALLATAGNEILSAASKQGVMIAFEAAVSGCIPIIKAVREGLAANRIEWIAGIINGTSNYILSEMRSKKLPFAAALAAAQQLGYAEADPTFDIEGIDAAQKLTLLSAIGFGIPVQFERAYIEGISKLTDKDITYAEELGYRIKLLGIARRTEAGIETRVHPCMVPENSPLARVDGVYNAVVAEGDFVGRVMLEGRGAGAGPTASAVVADLIDLARGRAAPVWGAAVGSLSDAPSVPMSAYVGAYYLRLMVLDRPGVIADVAGALRDSGVSLESMLQHGRAPGEAVPIVLVTHETRESQMREALDRIQRLESVLERPSMIRIEHG